MNKRYITSIITAILAVTVLLTSCNKDLNVNGDWKDVSVVFGLLDQQNTTHYIKINKVFLGEADAYDMAQVRDSSEYASVSGAVEEWRFGQLQKSFPLYPVTVTDKEAGDFYGPNQTLYAFDTDRLDSLATYKLRAIVNEGTEGEKEITAQTEIIDEIRLEGFIRIYKNSGIPFAGPEKLVDPNFEIQSMPDAKIYEVYVIFNYTEVFENSNGDTTMVPKNINMLLGEYKTKTAEGGQSMTVNLSSEQFYQRIGDVVPTILASDPELKKRIVGDIDIKVVAGGEDLNTYLEVNEPTTGIVQDKKEYTNIDNGIGIFSCRTSKTEVLELDFNSIKELMDGDITSGITGTGNSYTGGRGFCNNYTANTQCEACFPADGVDPCY